MKYRPNPDNPARPLVDVEPRDLYRFRKLVFRSLAGFPFSRDTKEDLFQDAVIAAWQFSRAYGLLGYADKPPEVFMAGWLQAYARNRARYLIKAYAQRTLRHGPPVDATEYEEAIGENASTPEERADARSILTALARDLPPERIRAIDMYVGGVAVLEIAAAMGVSPKTIYAWIDAIQAHGAKVYGAKPVQIRRHRPRRK